MGKLAATDRPCLRSLSHSFTLDFIITGSSYALLEHEVKPLVAHFLGERGLELSPTKTHLTSIEDGFDCLGQHLRKYAGKLLIKPARKNMNSRSVVQVTCPFNGMSKLKAQPTRMTPNGKCTSKNASA